MKEDNNIDFINDNFFVISSDNIESVVPKFYGYALTDDEFIWHGDVRDCFVDKKASGLFINIIKNNNSIYIQQDYWGNFALYLYRDNNYFAISNSLLYLSVYLADKNNISLDNDYLKYFFVQRLCSVTFTKTAIQGIVRIPKNVSIEIDNEKKIKFHKFIQQEFSKRIDTREGIDILDAWHARWSNLIRLLNSQGLPFKVFLSGGMDSRAVFSIFRNNTINLKNLHVSSRTPEENKKYEADYAVALKIAETYGVTLNSEPFLDAQPISNNISVIQTILAKAFLHKEYYYHDHYYTQPFFNFGGGGGECIRGAWDSSTTDYLINSYSDAKNCFAEYAEIFTRCLLYSFAELKEFILDKKILKEHELLTFYKNTRQRSHFGTYYIEHFLSNTIACAPLLDPYLYDLSCKTYKTKDMDLIFAVIYERFLPELSDIPFDVPYKKISEQTMCYAKKINNEFAKKEISMKEIIFPSFARKFPKNIRNKEDITPEDFYLQKFEDGFFKERIVSLFGDKLYEKVNQKIPAKSASQIRDINFLTTTALLDTYLDYQDTSIHHTDRSFQSIFDILKPILDSVASK